jgi:DNA polymerase-3 subunit gamma/tau
MDHEHDPPGPPLLPDESLLFSTGAPAAYRVLARKYRPCSFTDLIGQEPMVRTLENAFELGRIHQAYLLTGVRGVGKTTTARILARAFNFELPAAEGRAAINQPTIHMPELGVHCQAIIDSRHVDVLEMDAASHTGIDDVREIIDNARYRPVMARTKVYIIDEVHMLSKAAFNGLLKTLEEPPEHVKFIFATTEIDKVPVTVRSRCQRFDLRRIDAGLLAAHLRKICQAEQVMIEADALAMIARAAEGSVRDALSLLDQAIAHGAAHGKDGAIVADDLRLMLGVADKARVIDLFEATMAGDIATAIALLEDQYNGGADPAQALLEMAEFAHLATRFKLAPETAVSSALTPEEKRRGRAAAEKLSIQALTRAWQILMKGVDELRASQRPLQAADMVLVRLAYAADLPTPGEALKQLLSPDAAPPAASGSPSQSKGLPRSGGGGGAVGSAQASPREELATLTTPRPALNAPASVAQTMAIASFEALVALAEEKRDMRLKLALDSDVRLVRFEPGRIEFELAPGGARDLASTLTQKLQAWTNERWMVSIVAAGGAPTLNEQRAAIEQARRSSLEADPMVAAVLAHFPGAQIVAVRGRDDGVATTGTPAPAEEVVWDDAAVGEED